MELKIKATDSRLFYHGRNVVLDDTVSFDWPGTGFSMRFFSGTFVIISFGKYEEAVPTYVKVFLDNTVQTHAVCVSNQKIVVPVFGNKAHSLKLVRISEANHCLNLEEIVIKGENAEVLHMPEHNGLKIEFVGDSLTSGYGNLSERDVTCFRSYEEDNTLSYSYLTGKALDADIRCVSFSGKGIVNNWDGSLDMRIPEFFEYATRSTKEKWDFSKWTPDFVVLNAGTNDASAKVPDDVLIEGMAKLVSQIRSKYSDAKIILVHGFTTTKYREIIKSSVKNISQNNGGNVYLMEVKGMQKFKDELGGNGHPNVKSHKRVAKKLISLIRSLTEDK